MLISSGNALFSVHGGSDSSDGIAGMLGGFLSAIESLLNLPPDKIFAGLLPGIATMDNIHPLFVHFPIAFLTAFFLIDLSASLMQKPEWRFSAGWFLYLGTIFAGLTAAAGLYAASTVVHGENVHEIMETHEHLGITIFLLALVLSAWRLIAKTLLSGAANYLFLTLAGLVCLLLVLAADLGGLMVYKYGVAVAAVQVPNTEAFSEHPHEHVHAH